MSYIITIAIVAFLWVAISSSDKQERGRGGSKSSHRSRKKDSIKDIIKKYRLPY